MAMGTKRAAGAWLRRLLSLSAALGLLVPAAQARLDLQRERRALEARVGQVRDALAKQSPSLLAEPGEPAERVAQWYNWPNWNNWNKSPDWNKWANWFNR